MTENDRMLQELGAAQDRLIQELGAALRECEALKIEYLRGRDLKEVADSMLEAVNKPWAALLELVELSKRH